VDSHPILSRNAEVSANQPTQIITSADRVAGVFMITDKITIPLLNEAITGLSLVLFVAALYGANPWVTLWCMLFGSPTRRTSIPFSSRFWYPHPHCSELEPYPSHPLLLDLNFPLLLTPSPDHRP